MYRSMLFAAALVTATMSLPTSGLATGWDGSGLPTPDMGTSSYWDGSGFPEPSPNSAWDGSGFPESDDDRS